MFGLKHIISPHGPDAFLDRYWGQTALHIPGPDNKFDGLFGWDDINHALAHGRLKYPDVKLVFDKQGLPPDALDELETWLRRGATLVIDHVQLFDAVVDQFASTLARDLNTRVNINCYVSWPAKQGFDVHFDRHDVFIVQVDGRKAWKVAPPSHSWPVEQELISVTAPADLQPYVECSLGRGDVLYIPRGHWHYAIAETPSIHLTVGPVPVTGVDVLSWLTAHLTATDDSFRKGIPLAGAKRLGGDRPADELQEYWHTLRDRLIDVLRQDDLLAGFLQACMTWNAPRRAYQLPHLVMLEEQLTLNTRFELPLDQKALIDYRAASREAIVTMRGRSLKLENVPERLIQTFFMTRGTVRGIDLLAKCPEISESDVRAFLLRLFQQGLLVLAGHETA